MKGFTPADHTLPMREVWAGTQGKNLEAGTETKSICFLRSQFPSVVSIHTALDCLEVGPGTSVVGSTRGILIPTKARGDLFTKGPILLCCLEVHGGLGLGHEFSSVRVEVSGLKQAWAESTSLCMKTMYLPKISKYQLSHKSQFGTLTDMS